MNTREEVRKFYGNVATTPGATCCAPGCCGPSAEELSALVGYTDEQLSAIPEQANLGLGCGNPLAIAELREGETVVDLGSGAGIDVFLAAAAVGPNGLSIGVDMTQEMLEKARQNAGDQYTNVEFRLGEIEHLPIADNTVDAVISNCVINLSTDKAQVYREVFRVLRPGGRVRVSDVLAHMPLPDELRSNLDAVAACVGGAVTVDETRQMLEDAGFTEIEVVLDEASAALIDSWVAGAGKYVASAKVYASKPE